jgi:hypothetical protein
MENKTNIITIFPIPIYVNTIPSKYSTVVNFLENIDIMDPLTSKNFGRRSKDSYVLNKPPCLKLSKYILEETTKYGSECLGYSYEEYKFSQSWVSHKHPGEEHITHKHPNSLISGIFYYGKIDNNVPQIRFHKPEFNESTHPKLSNIPNDYNYSMFTLLPIPGMLILFPSELLHSVPKNETNIIRKSLAFNIVPKEGFGEEKNLTQLKIN